MDDPIIKDQNAFELTATQTEAKTPWASVAKNQTFDKTLWVSGVGAKAHASGFGVSGTDVTFTNKGTIYVTSGEGGVNYPVSYTHLTLPTILLV